MNTQSNSQLSFQSMFSLCAIAYKNGGATSITKLFEAKILELTENLAALNRQHEIELKKLNEQRFNLSKVAFEITKAQRELEQLRLCQRPLD